MKVLLEIIVIVFLLAAGWRQSYRDHLVRIFHLDDAAAATPRPRGASPAAATPRATPRPDSSWMWSPGPLDTRPR